MEEHIDSEAYKGQGSILLWWRFKRVARIIRRCARATGLFCLASAVALQTGQYTLSYGLPFSVGTVAGASSRITLRPHNIVGAAPSFYTAIAFADARHAWLARTDGLFATSDGGITWRRQGPSSWAVVALDVLSSRTAWAIGVDRLLGTTDGGLHWQRLGEPRAPLRSVAFTSSKDGLGIAVARSAIPAGWQQYPDLGIAGTVVRTHDGGRTWLASPALSRVDSLCFSDLRAGWAATGSRVWRTRDGGATYQPSFAAPLAKRGDWIARISCGAAAIGAVEFIGSGVASNQQPYIIYHTDDSGAHWRADMEEGYFSPVSYPRLHARLAPGGYRGPIDLVGRSAIFVVSLCPICGLPGKPAIGTVIMDSTLDGGRSWAARIIPYLTGGPIALVFLTPAHGWIAGMARGRRMLLDTIDGGRGWRVRSCPSCAT